MVYFDHLTPEEIKAAAIEGGKQRAINAGSFIWDEDGINIIVSSIHRGGCIKEGRIDYTQLHRYLSKELGHKISRNAVKLGAHKHLDVIIQKLSNLGYQIRPYESPIEVTPEYLDSIVANIILFNCYDDKGAIEYKRLAIIYGGLSKEKNLRNIVERHWNYIRQGLNNRGYDIKRVGDIYMNYSINKLKNLINDSRYRLPNGNINYSLLQTEIFPYITVKKLREYIFTHIIRKERNREP